MILLPSNGTQKTTKPPYKKESILTKPPYENKSILTKPQYEKESIFLPESAIVYKDVAQIIAVEIRRSSVSVENTMMR